MTDEIHLPERLLLRENLQGRYKSFLVQEGDYLLSLSRYVHLNAVRGVSLGRGNPAERRKRLRGFKWSTSRGYARLSAPFPFVQEAMLLDELRGLPLILRCWKE